jgi:pyruvate formate lyase activating enzyme
MNQVQDLHPGRWWHEEDGRFVCDLCPRRCHLKPGQRAFCFVRQATDHGIALTTWGRSSGFCIDPIEKKPLNHFLPGTPIFSFGTAGCNLGCRFCQNWDISKAREMDRLMDRATPEAIAEVAEAHDCRSVAFTYNDPVIFAEYALDTAEACHARGLKTVAVTAGYITEEARGEFFAGIDAANVDLKAFTERFYKELCFARLGPVLETLKYLVHETDTWVEITTLLIPGENDSDAELNQLTGWIHDELGPHVPLHFTAYHPDFKLDRPATPPETLTRARRIGMQNGLWFVYTGNVIDPEGGSTWCPQCHALLIERRGYTLGTWGLDAEGHCKACGFSVPGVFEERPGTWGSRRQPVHIGG